MLSCKIVDDIEVLSWFVLCTITLQWAELKRQQIGTDQCLGFLPHKSRTAPLTSLGKRVVFPDCAVVNSQGAMF